MDRAAINERFRASLVELVNASIKSIGIQPQEVATIFAEEAREALGYLAWLPHPQRAAKEHLVAAAACLRDGRVIPVPGFETMFPAEHGTATDTKH